MRFTTVVRDDVNSKKAHDYIMENLCDSTHVFDQENPEIIITIGGDGTLLEAFQRYKESLEDVMFVGLHTGTLGFYADWIIEEIDEMIAAIRSEKYAVSEFPIVQFEIEGKCGFRRQVALNEFVITNTAKTLAIDVYINDVFFESFRGTGLCVSTPSGSTAYNKALHGAIIHPHIEAFQLAEIASINNNVYRTISSPIILAKNHILTFKITNSDGVTLTYDHLQDKFLDIKTITTKLSPQKIRFARYKKHGFWERVHNAFL